MYVVDLFPNKAKKVGESNSQVYTGKICYSPYILKRFIYFFVFNILAMLENVYKNFLPS
jgi:hypothetical protein